MIKFLRVFCFVLFLFLCFKYSFILVSTKGGKEDGGVLGIESWEVEVLKKQKQSLYYSVFRAKKNG